MRFNDIVALAADLQKNTDAEVHFDPIHKKVYSVDASIYEIEPLGIVLPKSKEDIFKIVKIAKDYGIPLTARGAATGITGGCLGEGLIIDTSKYLNKILTINYEEEYAIFQPGVVQDQLNKELNKRGYRLGPDTSTGDRATLGGMMANNSAGARSLRFGKMVDHVEALQMVLSSGEVLYFEAADEQTWKNKCLQNDAEGGIYREIERIRDQYREEIIHRFPHIPRHVSGYNFDELLKPGPFNICKLITGSEGTLGIATEMRVRICKKPVNMGLCIIHFNDISQGMFTIPDMLAHNPLSLEMIDKQIIERGRQSPSMRGRLDWLEENPEMIFVAEFDGNTKEETQQKLLAFQKNMREKKIGYVQVIVTDPVRMNYVWDLRKAGLGLLLSKRTYSRAIAFIEDISIGPKELPPFMEKFINYLKSVGKEAGIYGHVGSGCMHIRPFIDLRSQDERKLMQKIMEDVSDLVLQHKGAMSGEHGDGIVRSWLNQKMFGDKLYQGFVELKAAFDPDNRMNPGKIVHPAPFLENLRHSPSTTIPTFLDFSREGGLELAADLCNGNGLCRKSEKVMCPSFQATQDEYDTTRARAQALRSVMNGQLPSEDFTSHALYDVLDLCLECKGCKTECPSQVDMAKMKAEFLYQYQEKHGYSLRNRLFGHIGRINAISSPFSGAFNAIGKNKLFKSWLSWLGITPHRTLPALAKQRFSQWFQKQPKLAKNKGTVVLFNDTFMEFNSPQIGQSAVKILRALDYEVIVPSWNCCGRPLISKGFLKDARAKAIRLIEILHPFAENGIPIVGLEPSCILTIKDDFLDLIGDQMDKKKVKTVCDACLTLDEFLASHLDRGQLPLRFKRQNKIVKLHGHCHQKSLVGTKKTLDVLSSVPGFHVSEIPSGCCGLAGSFGYEKEHYAISMQIGELHLFPAVRSSAPDVMIVANGTSCRSQITQGTQRQAIHLAEAIASTFDIS